MFHPIDVYVGKRVRFKRKVLGLTQSDLAEKVEITFQQIQKYEKVKIELAQVCYIKLPNLLTLQLVSFLKVMLRITLLRLF